MTTSKQYEKLVNKVIKKDIKELKDGLRVSKEKCIDIDLNIPIIKRYFINSKYGIVQYNLQGIRKYKIEFGIDEVTVKDYSDRALSITTYKWSDFINTFTGMTTKCS